MNYQKKSNLSFTFLEILITIVFIVVLGYFIYGAFINFLKTTTSLRLILQALNILESELEIIRNMKYEDIGIKDGYPRGVLERKKYVRVGELNFLISYYIRNIDDPFDGTVTTTPQDLAPADYKLVELEIECLNCGIKFKPQKLTTFVAPKNLEITTNNGSLFIKVIDARGEVIPQAKVTIFNNKINPPILIEDYTNNDGILPLIDIPTGTNAYEITVSKNGYSTEKTYTPGDPRNPNPINPHATVIEKTLTVVTLAIDKLSNLKINTKNKFCKQIGDVHFKIYGTKLIGKDPDIVKFSTTTFTDQNGSKFLENIEWDEYNFEILNNNYVLRGAKPPLPLTLFPSTTRNIDLILTSKNSNLSNLLIKVIDVNKLPIKFASITLSRTNFSKTLITDSDSFYENNWINNYSEKSQNIEIDNNDGYIKLKYLADNYPTNTEEWLISNTIDFGTSTDLLKINWEGEEPSGTDIKLQIAINNDNSTWNFVGPDGTSNSYFDEKEITNLSLFRNFRYLRYKVYLTTFDPQQTPIFKFINFQFSSDCLPPGQVLFTDLNLGTYQLKVEKEGYQKFLTNIDILESFKQLSITLVPQ